MHGDAGKIGVQVAAQEVLAALKAYSLNVDSLVSAGWDAERYREAAELFERMRTGSARLREVQVHWIELLITRFEMAHALWAAGQASGSAEAVRASHERHLAAIEKYARTCGEHYLQGRS